MEILSHSSDSEGGSWMLRMISEKYSCSAVSVPSLGKGDTLSPSTEETLFPRQMRNYSGPFWKGGAEARYPSAISFCIKENPNSDC